MPGPGLQKCAGDSSFSVCCAQRVIVAAMNADTVAREVKAVIEELGLDADQFDSLAGSLVWRIGRLSDDTPVTVRLGTTAALERFAELPRLRNATDQELEEAIAEGSLHVEWVGPRP